MLVVAGIIYVLLYPPDFIFTLYEIQTVELILIIFFSYGFIVQSIKLIKDEPAITLNNDGVILNNSSFSQKLILWNDILKIESTLLTGHEYLVIKLINTEEYIKSEKNIFKRKGMRLNYKQLGSPICLTTIGLKLPHEEIRLLMIEYFYRNKKK